MASNIENNIDNTSNTKDIFDKKNLDITDYLVYNISDAKADLIRTALDMCGVCIDDVLNEVDYENDNNILDNILSTIPKTNDIFSKGIARMGNWYHDNVHTMYGSAEPPFMDSRQYYCNLINGNVEDTGVGFLVACFKYIGLLGASNTMTIEALNDINSTTMSLFIDMGFEIYPFDSWSLANPFDILIGENHVEIFFGNVAGRRLSFHWDSINDGYGLHGMPCASIDANYAYILRLPRDERIGIRSVIYRGITSPSGETLPTLGAMTDSTSGRQISRQPSPYTYSGYMPNPDGFNVAKAIEALMTNNRDNGHPPYSSYIKGLCGWCAQAVNRALAHGGIRVNDRPGTSKGRQNGMPRGWAYEYIKWLPTKGFKLMATLSTREQQRAYQALPGDIAVMYKPCDASGYPNTNEPGHICMWNGTHWVSDFIQASANVYGKIGNTTIYFFRFT